MEFRSPECESPRGFLHWGAEMRIESTGAGLGEFWSEWEEYGRLNYVTARSFDLGDVMDRIAWAMERAGGAGVSERAAAGGMPTF